MASGSASEDQPRNHTERESQISPRRPSRSEGGNLKIKTWNKEMSLEETKDLAYWERNVLALKYADGYYEDRQNNYPGWLRVLSLDGGRITFHIPDEFEVGSLRKIEPNWDGHTTEEKWKRILSERGIT